jgi:hypothetical protein
MVYTSARGRGVPATTTAGRFGRSNEGPGNLRTAGSIYRSGDRGAAESLPLDPGDRNHQGRILPVHGRAEPDVARSRLPTNRPEHPGHSWRGPGAPSLMKKSGRQQGPAAARSTRKPSRGESSGEFWGIPRFRRKGRAGDGIHSLPRPISISRPLYIMSRLGD